MTNEEFQNLVEALMNWQVVESGEPPRSSSTAPASNLSAAQADPVSPSYYPQPDPFVYALAHGLDAIEFSVVKYVTRWRKKDGLKDLLKLRKCVDRLIEAEEAQAR